ncbi:B-cell antigen receptor complex-associated protein alpha chain [Hypomesus transpacificus]|uniref:B-cell antigen receptor complex-associated protein alpha chain n=1 Tax=Hypomesus transpacificus TaxID=137520 RepID=UPI001F074B6F|nr:B-cell antigen receptor complex-associated protein alpha chain [Hypomesus transpacificus]
MNVIAVLFLFGWAVVSQGDRSQGDRSQATLEADRPSLRVQLSHAAHLQCCYHTTGGALTHVWIHSVHTVNGTGFPMTVDLKDPRVTVDQNQTVEGVWCHHLSLSSVQLEDSGLYQCLLNGRSPRSSMYTHGTYLQVYKPMEKMFNLSETVKNRILAVEGVLLLVCVLLPGVILLFKAKRVNELEILRGKREEENIYEGLNLEDCSTTYDKIQLSLVQGAYQDVGYRVKEMGEDEEDDAQLQKP